MVGTDSTADSAGAKMSDPAPCLVPGPALGLANLGNTCFFNSSMQVLLACPQLAQAAAVGRGHAGAGPPETLAKGPLGFAFQQAVLNVTGGLHAATSGKAAYNPQALLAAVCRVAPQFKGKQQHDSHELLRLLLDGLQEEETRAAQYSRRRPSGDAMPSPSPGSAAPASAAALSGSGASGCCPPLPAAPGPALSGKGGAATHNSTESTVDAPSPFATASAVIGSPSPSPSAGSGRPGGAAASGLELEGGAGRAAGPASASGDACGACGSGCGGGDAPGLIGRLFGGELASRLTCLQCGYCSVSSERFFDLSLPIPDLPEAPKPSAAALAAAAAAAAAPAAAPDKEASASAEGCKGKEKGGKGKAGKGDKRQGAGAEPGTGNQVAGAAAAAAAPEAAKARKLTPKQRKKLEKEERDRQRQAKRQAKKDAAAEAEARSAQGPDGAEDGSSSSGDAAAAEHGGSGKAAGAEGREDGAAQGQPAKPLCCVDGKVAEPAASGSQEAAEAATPAPERTPAPADAEAAACDPAQAANPPGSSSGGAAMHNDGLAQGDTPGVQPGAGDEVQQGEQRAEGSAPPPAAQKGASPATASATYAVEAADGAVPIAAAAAAATNGNNKRLCGKKGKAAFAHAPGAAAAAEAEGLGAAPLEPAAAVANGGRTAPLPLAAAPPAAVLDLCACLRAFLAAEEVAWECPREKAEATAMSAVSSQGATPSLSASMRKQVSWSPAAPQVFVIPGSTEQRGTHLRDALAGAAPFFRPCRVHGAAFLVQAQLDPQDTSLLHLQLLPQANSPRAAQLLEAAGGQPLPSPAMGSSPVVTTILATSPRGAGGAAAGRERSRSSDGGGGSASPFSESGLALARLDVGVVWRYPAGQQGQQMQAAAQVVLDCVADLLRTRGGVQYVRDMLSGGLRLARQAGRFRLLGRRPQHAGAPLLAPLAKQAQGARGCGRQRGGDSSSSGSDDISDDDAVSAAPGDIDSWQYPPLARGGGGEDEDGGAAPSSGSSSSSGSEGDGDGNAGACSNGARSRRSSRAPGEASAAPGGGAAAAAKRAAAGDLLGSGPHAVPGPAPPHEPVGVDLSHHHGRHNGHHNHNHSGRHQPAAATADAAATAAAAQAGGRGSDADGLFDIDLEGEGQQGPGANGTACSGEPLATKAAKPLPVAPPALALTHALLQLPAGPPSIASAAATAALGAGSAAAATAQGEHIGCIAAAGMPVTGGALGGPPAIDEAACGASDAPRRGVAFAAQAEEEAEDEPSTPPPGACCNGHYEEAADGPTLELPPLPVERSPPIAMPTANGTGVGVGSSPPAAVAADSGANGTGTAAAAGERRTARTSSGGLKASSGRALQRPSSKRYLLSRAPELLVLHLKRFEMDARGRLRKIDKHVAFGPTLDLQPFLEQAGAVGGEPPAGVKPAAGQVQVQVGAQQAATNGARVEETCDGGGGAALPGGDGGPCRGEPPRALVESPLSAALAANGAGRRAACEYELIGIVEHSGQLRFGHYVAYVKRGAPHKAEGGKDKERQQSHSHGHERDSPHVHGSGGGAGAGAAHQWYYVSDAQVRPVPEAQVLRAQAYLLMYVRRHQQQH